MRYSKFVNREDGRGRLVHVVEGRLEHRYIMPVYGRVVNLIGRLAGQITIYRPGLGVLHLSDAITVKVCVAFTNY